ncbi:hypothetical protein Sp245p_31170 (plasmid) [Azospirillum baldaniorum]|uniref:Uncharacterized protein n=2 Tax=Azospirillum baldaniorum TaxID=1064539 RepID=A0A9P1NSN4_9PROT|nr:hypothetical protein Sp245p_31170 [Azospirillum baldaniorum]CCD03900.1 protein of unknown function [Azospirillum baldaniorum]
MIRVEDASRMHASGGSRREPAPVDPLLHRLRRLGLPEDALEAAADAYADSLAAALAAGADPAAALERAAFESAGPAPGDAPHSDDPTNAFAAGEDR